jgi:hypothetical protein
MSATVLPNIVVERTADTRSELPAKKEGIHLC